MNDHLHTQKGITLIELITVVLIMGIVVAVAAPLFTGLIGDQELDIVEANLVAIRNAERMYILGTGTFASDVDGMVTPGDPSDDLSAIDIGSLNADPFFYRYQNVGNDTELSNDRINAWDFDGPPTIVLFIDMDDGEIH